MMLFRIGIGKHMIHLPLPPGCSPELRDIITRCLHHDASLRPTAAQLEREIDAILLLPTQQLQHPLSSSISSSSSSSSPSSSSTPIPPSAVSSSSSSTSTSNISSIAAAISVDIVNNPPITTSVSPPSLSPIGIPIAVPVPPSTVVPLAAFAPD
jgi:serine/threonine protein kinase